MGSSEVFPHLLYNFPIYRFSECLVFVSQNSHQSNSHKGYWSLSLECLCTLYPWTIYPWTLGLYPRTVDLHPWRVSGSHNARYVRHLLPEITTWRSQENGNCLRKENIRCSHPSTKRHKNNKSFQHKKQSNKPVTTCAGTSKISKEMLEQQ